LIVEGPRPVVNDGWSHEDKGMDSTAFDENRKEDKRYIMLPKENEGEPASHRKEIYPGDLSRENSSELESFFRTTQEREKRDRRETDQQQVRWLKRISTRDCSKPVHP
jgi:hypothetical protein